MRRAVLFAAALALPGASAPTVGAEGAMRMMLAASSLPIPASSTCHAIVPGVPRPTLGDLLATPLAALDGGENRVAGGCDRGQCRVQITHSAGEDVFSSEYRFRTAHGKLTPASLRCFGTP